MKKALLLLALTIACAHGANDAPFAALESVSGERFAAVANRIEYQNMMLLPEYAVTARHYYLAPGDAWLAAPDPAQWQEVSRENGTSQDGVAYAFIEYRRRQAEA